MLDFNDITEVIFEILRSYEVTSITEIYEKVSKFSKVTKKRGSPINSPNKKSRSNSRNNSPKT